MNKADVRQIIQQGGGLSVAFFRYYETAETKPAIQNYLRIKNRNYFREEILYPKIKQGLLAFTIPAKPKSSN
ncbi:MAG: Fic family protein [Fidelibacterota bacterium]